MVCTTIYEGPVYKLALVSGHEGWRAEPSVSHRMASSHLVFQLANALSGSCLTESNDSKVWWMTRQETLYRFFSRKNFSRSFNGILYVSLEGWVNARLVVEDMRVTFRDYMWLTCSLFLTCIHYFQTLVPGKYIDPLLLLKIWKYENIHSPTCLKLTISC